jgi:acylphosphatase
MTEMACARVLIGGRVQGVGFRYFATSRAEGFQVSGFVRNLDTGDVEIEVEGTKQEIIDFLSELRKGPTHGTVGDFQLEWKPFKMLYDHFFVKY